MSTQFNHKAYLACDEKAKNALRKFLDRMGIFTLIFEDYSADIKSLEMVGGKYVEVLHEVEVKSSYIDEFKWDTVHIPARKKKLLKNCYTTAGLRIIFWVLNKDCTKGMMIDGKYMKDAYIENIPNTRNPGGEDFYDIPIELCREVRLCT
jgi:hypothetical protein